MMKYGYACAMFAGAALMEVSCRLRDVREELLSLRFTYYRELTPELKPLGPRRESMQLSIASRETSAKVSPVSSMRRAMLTPIVLGV